VERMIELDELNDTREHVELMRSLMEGIVLALVDSKDSVVVKAVPSMSEVAIVITVATKDRGRLIGGRRSDSKITTNNTRCSF
jgi:hypothetical protein